MSIYSTANAEQTYFAIRSGKANESMLRQSLKPRQYAAASGISPRSFASVRRGMPRSAT
ncbi:hypothetical protein DPMN_175618 [Dreissena polymorpha]|uniref:Uncharacterized protein n=1 Tax=Dreissena polymorpha TaxID=45954 RepID=A0A9D4E9Q7_DREPO|nr:hypothetical protein DPMN_175618 [Dreissena polymorpha]